MVAHNRFLESAHHECLQGPRNILGRLGFISLTGLGDLEQLQSSTGSQLHVVFKDSASRGHGFSKTLQVLDHATSAVSLREQMGRW
jgi:hypothetical protein